MGSMAGDEVLNLTGEWTLDKERSQSMYPHMKAMGCDEIAALASEKLNITLSIVQSGGVITVWQKSQLGMTKRMLRIGQETTEASGQGDRKVVITMNDNQMLVDTRFKKGRLLDTRSLQQGGDGNLLLVTTLALTLKGVPGHTRTTRYFVRSGEPDTDIINTHNQALASGSLMPATTLSSSALRASQQARLQAVQKNPYILKR